MSIVRVGLGEAKDFGDGYDLIFGKKGEAEPIDEPAKPDAEGKEPAEKAEEK